MVGSTPLGERLDPEALRGVLTRFAAKIERVAEHHGGQAGDLMGDGLMCVFGVPAAHEDDALRAVRAAAEMAAAVEQLNKRLRTELDVELAVRIGVNTGEGMLLLGAWCQRFGLRGSSRLRCRSAGRGECSRAIVIEPCELLGLDHLEDPAGPRPGWGDDHESCIGQPGHCAAGRRDRADD